MSAETLRKAAEKLREEANAATPGPWDANMHSADMGGRHGWSLRGPRNLGPNAAVLNARMVSGNAHYIATMHPGVGLALADTLDHVSGLLGEHRDDLAPDTTLGGLLRVARLILGGAS